MSVMVKDVMDRKQTAVSVDTTIKELIKLMVKHDVRFVAVVNELGIVVGGISESDLIKLVRIQPVPTAAAVWTKMPPGVSGKKVREIMNPRPVTINERANLTDALNLMSLSNVNALIVVDNDNKFAGVVKLRNIIEQMME